MVGLSRISVPPSPPYHSLSLYSLRFSQLNTTLAHYLKIRSVSLSNIICIFLFCLFLKKNVSLEAKLKVKKTDLSANGSLVSTVDFHLTVHVIQTASSHGFKEKRDPTTQPFDPLGIIIGRRVRSGAHVKSIGRIMAYTWRGLHRAVEVYLI